MKHSLKRWRVVSQASHRRDIPTCQHRWGWTAELCARRRTVRVPATGILFTAYPSEATDAHA